MEISSLRRNDLNGPVKTCWLRRQEPPQTCEFSAYGSVNENDVSYCLITLLGGHLALFVLVSPVLINVGGVAIDTLGRSPCSCSSRYRTRAAR